MCAHRRQSPALQFVDEVPPSVAPVLDAHVAQHHVEVVDRHVERLGHLCRRERVLRLLVECAQHPRHDLVGHPQYLRCRRVHHLRARELCPQIILLPLSSFLFPRHICPRNISPQISLQFLPSDHQSCSCLVVELRGDVERLDFRQRVVGHQLLPAVRQIVGFLQEGKFSSLYFLPGWLHLSDGFQHIIMLLAGQRRNLQRGHARLNVGCVAVLIVEVIETVVHLHFDGCCLFHNIIMLFYVAPFQATIRCYYHIFLFHYNLFLINCRLVCSPRVVSEPISPCQRAPSIKF